MTLALYGKSRGRKALLILAAFLAVAIAVLGGTTLQNAEDASAAEGVNIDQWGNKVPKGWQNGNLNEASSEYHEGDSVAFRAILTGLTPGQTYVLRIGYDALEGGNHAYDYLTPYNVTEPDATPCSGVAGCTGSGLTSGAFTLWNGTLGAINFVTPPTTSGTVEHTAAVTFTPTSATAVLAWGGHIATTVDWPPPATTAVVDTSGSPYHMRIKELKLGSDTVAGGSQDRSLKATAVIVDPRLSIAKSNNVSGIVAAGGTFNWIVTVTVAGNTTTANATVADTLPAGFTVNAAITDAASGGGDATKMTCTANAAVPGATGFNCTLASGAPVGTYTITIPTRAPSSPPTSVCTAYTNSATLTGGGGTITGSPATNNVTVTNCTIANLTVTKTNNLGGANAQIGVPYDWTLTISNTGTQAATFPASATVFTDNLPTTGVTYGALSSPSPAQTGLTCSVASNTISCVAGAGGYTLGPSASFAITIPATPTQAGTIANPGTGVCIVDPSGVVTESNETDNTCSNTVIVAPDPTVQKVGNAAASSPTTAAWTVTVNNNGTNAIAQTVKLTEDAGATFGTPSFTAGGSCGAQSGTEITCTLPAGSVMTMPVTKTVTATCAGGPATNSVTLSVLRGASYVQVGSVSNVSVTVPGDPGLCIRTVTVCKVITNNNDGVADDAIFNFTTTAPGPANLSTPLATEGGSVVCATPFNLQANQTTTITETVPSGWLTPSYLFSGGQTNSGSNGAVVATNSGNVTVTFTNVKDSRQITVCKAVTNNNDGASDSATFTFDSTHNGTGTDASILQSEANTAPCQTFTAPITGFDIAESVPTGWSLTGWNITSGGAGSGTTNTAAIPAGTADLTVTFTNVRASRTLQVCKIVENNNDELSGQGGTFNFSLTGSTNSVPGVPATETQTEQCGATVIIPTTALSVSEGALPSGFTNASGYPKYQVDGGSVTAGGTANVAEGTANVKVTFINRAPTGTLTINKTLIPSGDAGRFDLDRDGGTHEATNVGNTGTTGAMTVSAGSHTVAEFGGTTPATNLADYDTTVTCTGDTGPQSTTSRSVTVAEGANVVCTFTNTREPKLTVVKDLFPANDTGRFDLINGATTYTGPGGAGFGDGGSTGSQYAAIGPNAFGETAHAGTSLTDYVTSASCTGGTGFTFSSATATGSITLAAGDDVTCTVTNNRKARITITKVTDPASDPQDFTFSASGPNAYSDSATLDTDGVSADPSSKTLSGLVPSSYTVTETNIPAGWALTNIACSGATVQYGGTSNTFVAGQSSVVIDAQAGNDVTCTFTNTKQARIIIEKDTLPASDTTTAFTFNPSWSETDFTLESDQSHTSPYLAPGTYSIVENALTGWDLTSATCNEGETIEDITLGAGETVTCTFVNTQRGRIIVDKVTDPAGSPESFNFHIDNGPSELNLDFSLTDTATPFDTGLIKPTTPGSTYAVSEDVPSAWLQGTVTCDGPVGEPSPASAVVVAPGETVTCTFNNAIKRGSITIEKQTSPNGASGTFSFTTTGSFLTPFSPSLSDGQDDTRGNLYPGTFTITETDPGANWHLQSIVCTSATDPIPQGTVGLPNRTVSIELDPAEDITCVFTNEQHGSITVIKDAIPNDGQDFAFTLTGQAGATLDDDADPENSNTKTWSNLAAGSFTLAETLGVQGWSLTDISCETADTSDAITRNVAAGTAAITLDPGESVTCTYTNKKDATLTIVKDAQPNGPQDFAFTTSGAGLSNFNLDDDADNTLSNTKAFTISGNDFGQKTITESAVGGWSLTGIICTEGTTDGATANVTVDPGDTITCTFTNKQDATLTIIKDADPNNAQDFAFTTSGSQLAGFELDDDGDGTLSNTKVFTISGTGFGEKSVSETTVAGWALTDINCTEGTVLGTTATVQVDPGDAITCTFTNKQDATVTIVKDAIPDSGQDFSFTVSGGGLTNFVLDDDGAGGSATPNSTTFTIPAADFGQKTITETNTPGWALTGIVCSEGTTDGSSATFTVDAGDMIRCTFTNKQDATLTIVKDAEPNSAQDFAFETTGLITTNFSLDDDADGDLPSSRQFTISGANFGTKTVTETATTGWSLTDITCTKGSDAGATATVDIQPGDSVTCTFTNKQDATVTIIKNAIPDGPQDFAFTTTGAGLSGFSLDDDNNGDLPNTRQFTISGSDFGPKTVTETGMTGWDLTSLICSEGSITGAQAAVQVDPGDTITCTFTNTQRGSITIIKDVVPNDAAADFDFTIDGAGSGNDSNRSLTDVSEADGAQLESNLLPGSYTVSEGSHAGYSTTVSCSNNATGTDSASFTLNPGENVTCTFVNSRLASLTIVKDAVPDSAQDFAFTTSGTGLSAFSLDDDANATLSNTTTFSNLSITPGSNVYDVTETAVAGWDLTNIVCPGADVVFGEPAAFAPGDRTAHIILHPGDDITCTFTNTQRGTIIVEKQTLPDGATGSFTFTGNAAGVISDNGTITVANLVPGTYSSTETALEGWDLTGLTCDDGGSVTRSTTSLETRTATFQVDPGETVRCVFTNTQRGQIVVDKVTLPSGSSQSFAFGLTGGPSALNQTFNLTDGATPHNSGVVLPGSGYAIAETAVTGWDLTSATCSDGSPVSNIDLAPGELVTCTFTNTQRGRVVTQKATLPASDTTTSFAFDPSWSVDDFNLVNGGSNDSGTLPPGSYSVTELVKAGWDLTNLVCTSTDTEDDVVENIGTRAATIDLDPGEVVTCTFTNTQRGTISIEKETFPGTPVSFGFTGVYNGSIQSGTIVTVTGILPGTHTSTETALAGWDLTGLTCDDGQSPTPSSTDLETRTATFKVDPGEHVHCIFTNTQRGTIVVEKQTTPDGATGTFTFTGNAAGAISDNGTITVNNLVPGTYTSTESALEGWDLTGLTCDDGQSATASTTSLETRTATFRLDPGETIRCTFTNTQRGTIIVEKQTTPASAQLFAFTGDANGSISDNGTITVANLVPGTYTSTETALEGWDLTGLTCDDGGSGTASTTSLETRTATFEVDPGETVRCVFTNTQRGSITVIKNAIPDSADDFNFTLTGQTGVTLDDDGDATNPNTYTWANLVPGAFTLEETGIPITGWDLTDLTCVSNQTSPAFGFTQDGGQAFLNVDPGEQITCTYENTARGRIIVDKVTQPAGAGQSFAFTLTGGNSNLDQAFDLTDGTTPHDSGLILPGTGYAIAETSVTGWDLTSATCSDGSPVSNINLAPGEVVTCTFTNTQRGNIQVVKVDQTSAAIPGRPSQWNFTITGPNGFSEARSIALGGGSVTIPNVPLGNGYSVVETEAIAGACPIPNPTATYRTTGPGGAQNLVTPGSTITFTFTNTECGVVASTGNLIINKYNDLNGNHVQDAGETPISGWNMTITGPQFPGGTVIATDSNGQIILLGIFTGAYTITEETRTTHTPVGVVTNDNAPVFTAGATTTSITLDFSDEDVVSFYNQPRSSIRVNKIQVLNRVTTPGSGWTFTLTGCGITPRSATTSTSGVVVFTNLQPAGPNCSYIVTESVSRGWTVSPAIAQAAAPAPGQEIILNFTNTRDEIVCVDCNPTPTPTATPTRTPTNTPTATPTRTPTQPPAQQTQGPIVLETPRPTPIAPNTGDGFGGGIASINTVIVLAAVIALGAGLLVTGTARKRNR